MCRRDNALKTAVKVRHNAEIIATSGAWKRHFSALLFPVRSSNISDISQPFAGHSREIPSIYLSGYGLQGVRSHIRGFPGGLLQTDIFEFRHGDEAEEESDCRGKIHNHDNFISLQHIFVSLSVTSYGLIRFF
jgi:hypothetical protein